MTMTPAVETVAATFNPLRKVYSRMNMTQWAVAVGLAGEEGSYIEEKWSEFLKLMRAYDRLGTLLPRMVAAGEEL